MDDIYKNQMRKEKINAICRFIATASLEDVTLIIEEIRDVHDNIMCYNAETKSLDKVEYVAINGYGIQLNLEKRIL